MKSRTLPARVYHLAEAVNWPSIRRRGLLSATALLDSAGVDAGERVRIECRQRLEHMKLPNGVYLRDQRPMPARALGKCLVDMTSMQWYALVNSKVFFWLDIARLNRQRAACEPRPQIVLEIDTARLVARHAERIALSPINTGNARRRPATRGRCTFVPYRVWVESGWSSERDGVGALGSRQQQAPVELTVADGLSNIMRYVVAIHRLKPGESFHPAKEIVSIPTKRSPRETPRIPLRSVIGIR